MPTREELYDTAQDLGIEGRSDMNKDQLEAAVAEAQREQANLYDVDEADEPTESDPLEGRTDVSQTAYNREREG